MLQKRINEDEKIKLKKVQVNEEKQVTRGHNIVADGWAGAFNPHPRPNPTPSLKHTQKISKTLVFRLFKSMTSNGPTEVRTKPLRELRVRNLKGDLSHNPILNLSMDQRCYQLSRVKFVTVSSDQDKRFYSHPRKVDMKLTCADRSKS